MFPASSAAPQRLPQARRRWRDAARHLADAAGRGAAAVMGMATDGTALSFHGPRWCDAVLDRNYNRAVKLPYPASHEELWRNDHLYDAVVILGHNEQPRIAGLGSAVFFHLADPKGGPTAGCIAVSAKDMRKVLAACGRKTKIRIW